MALKQMLREFNGQFESGCQPVNTPKAIIDIVHRATEAVRQSELAKRGLKTGDRAPAFTLNNQAEHTTVFTDLLAKGQLVITFVRGHW